MKILDSLQGNSSSYEPYKYVMSDIGNIYLGARYTYEELLNNDDVNFKLKAIINHYILKVSDASNSLESEFYHMRPDSNIYSVYEQLKVKIKVLVIEDCKGRTKKRSSGYTEKVMSLKELADMDIETKKGEGMVIGEIAVSKLALMSFTV